MKDFFDLWAIGGAFDFDGPVLARAMKTTFDRRATPIPTEIPAGLTIAFATTKQGQWAAFLGRTEIALGAAPLPELQLRIGPIGHASVLAIASSSNSRTDGSQGGPWIGAKR